MISKSFQILRTNPALTSNYKIVVSSNYALYLESFDSVKDLSNLKYKHFILNKNSYLEDNLPEFYGTLPANLAFAVKFDDDVNIAYKDYEYQFDDIYFSGAKNIEDQFYSEEFEYFAPLYIKKESLPSNFIIMRIDDPIIYDNDNNGFDVGNLNQSNFLSEIIDKWKCVKLFDLSLNTDLGYFLSRNITENERFPSKPLYINFKSDEFSKWYGMDYYTGVYTEKNINLTEILKKDNPHFLLEKYITDGYKNNKIIFPNILNLKFLFDDTPATPFELKKYSINRYYGFYIDEIDYVVSLTSYVTKPLKSNIELLNNIIISGGTNAVTWNNDISDYDIEPLSINPFIEEWNDNEDYFIYIKDTLHKVIRTYENEKYYYKIISKEVLDEYFDTGLTNLYTVDIEFDGDYNTITPTDNRFSIDQYLDCSNTERVMYSDLYLIKIDDKYHVLKNGSGITYSDPDIYNKNKLIDKYYIQTDYAINSNSEYLEYWILGNNSEYYKKINTQDYTRTPLTFPIYTVKFSDIKDFDYDRVNTDFANFDYEQTEYVKTQEEKLYATEYRDLSVNKDFKTQKANTVEQYNVSNISSEYIANDELFQIKNNTLTEIWRKNPYICKWGFSGSINHSDYPYKLNSTIIGGSALNRGIDSYNTYSDILGKTLDYFYRIGNFYSGTTNNIKYYKNQTTNIQTEFINANNFNFGNGFNLKKYFDSDIDYFEFYFNNNMYYQDNNLLYKKDFLKYSVFGGGDDINYSETIFKGLKYKIMPIENVTIVNGQIQNINIGKDKNYNGYKISVILNDIYHYEDGTISMNGINDEMNIIPNNINGIHIIMNDKFKNILIILNTVIYMKKEYLSFNNIAFFDEKEGLYNRKLKNGNDIYDTLPINQYEPNSITANDFIFSLNDLNKKYFGNSLSGDTNLHCDYVKYYYIDEFNNTIYNGSSYMNDLTYSTIDHVKSWKRKYPPFIIYAYQPDIHNIIINSYIYNSVFGPSKNKLGTSFLNDTLSEPIARQIELNKNITVPLYSNIYRYSGSYEPIFENISVFELSNFCFNDLETYTGVTTGYTQNLNSSNAIMNTGGDDSPLIKLWNDLNYLCKKTTSDADTENISNTPNSGTRTGSRSITTSTTRSVIYPNIILGTTEIAKENVNTPITSSLINVYFDFNIPQDAVIKGIEMYITRKCSHKNKVTGNKAYTQDMDQGTRIHCGSQTGFQLLDTFPTWETSFTTYKYGSPTDNWGLTTELTPYNVNNDFSFNYYLMLVKENTTTTNFVSQLNCISCKIYYDLNWTGYTYTSFNYFGNNYKFDNTKEDFGNTDEFIYSKVNTSSDILKYDNKNILNIYPMIDQFGYSYSNRFIFKSNWDKDYYYNTEDVFDDD